MSMSVGRPVGPTYSAPTPPSAQVAKPTTAAPVAQEPSQAPNTQAAFGAARQSVVGKTAETVTPSQGGAQIKQGIEQTDGGVLLEQGQSLLANAVVQSEFGSPASLPVKAVYALGNDSAVLGSADSLVNKVNENGMKEHSVIAQDGLSSLGEHDKLTIVGHGNTDTFGGMKPEELAVHLKESGVKTLGKISLKGCNSDQYAQKLFTALQAEGIQIGSITGRTAQVAVAQSGRTLVEHGDQMLHQVQGSKVEVSKDGVKSVYEGHSIENVQSKSAEIASMRHSGILGLDSKDYEKIIITLKNGTPSYTVSEDSIRRIASNIEKNNGEFISSIGKGKGPAHSEAIAAEIIANYKSKLTLPSSTSTTMETTDRAPRIDPKIDSVERKLFLQVQPSDARDGDLLENMSRKEFEELNQPGGKFIAVDVKKVLLGKIITCHVYAYDIKDNPEYKPDCQAVMDRADTTGKPYAVCFLEGKVAHSAFKDGEVWHQALRFGEHETSADAATTIFTTATIHIGDYEPVLIYEPGKPGSKENFIKVWGEQKEVVRLAEEAARNTREETTIEDMNVFYDYIIENCQKNPPEAISAAKKICDGISSDNGLSTKAIDMILVKLESENPKKEEITKIIEFIRKNRAL